jgi:hypothetical protein
LETATRNLASRMTELSSTKSAVADLTKMLNGKIKKNFVFIWWKFKEIEFLTDRTSEIVDIGRMPTSCFDLERMGHKLGGFFSVKGSEKMEMIYCDFFPNQNGIDVLFIFKLVNDLLISF